MIAGKLRGRSGLLDEILTGGKCLTVNLSQRIGYFVRIYSFGFPTYRVPRVRCIITQFRRPALTFSVGIDSIAVWEKKLHIVVISYVVWLTGVVLNIRGACILEILFNPV